MSWFQLDPKSIADRARGTGASVPTLGASLLRGMLGFTAVSIAGFIPWGVFGNWLHAHIGEVGLYITCAFVFIVLSGWLLHRLIIGPGSLSRFYKLFTLAFIAYSIAWISAWMLQPGHVLMNERSLAGLLAGAAVMGLILAAAFEAWSAWWQVILSIFVLNTVGYFTGQLFEGILIQPGVSAMQVTLGKMQWGLFYGLGLGAGLGLAFHLCQAEARRLLGETE
jgi:hypothetical protein